MFKLFGKKETSPEERLAECQKKRDWVGLAKAYYSLGTAAMDRGDLNRAQLWLHRADTVYSAQDEVYDKVGEKLTDDCSQRIGRLESEHILYNDAPAQVEEKAAGLGDVRVRIWGLLSLARLVKLGERLAVLPGCEALGRLGWAVDTALHSFQNPPSEEEFNGLRDLAGALYELGDSPAFWGAGSEVPAPAGAPFQVFDLNGMMGVHLEAEAYLSGQMEMAAALVQGQEPPAPETGIILGALLPDYYVRTGAARPEEVPQVKAELERIWSDYEFVCSGPSWEAVTERTAQYKKLDVLA
ncbi:MAG: hypothetical protein HFG07_00330 [Oscillibacter sp.]|nr:hypothetical protein [Oscillibacter sp.]